MVNKVLSPSVQTADLPIQASRLQKGILAAVAVALSGFLPFAFIQFQKSSIRAEAARVEQQLTADPVTGLLLAIQAIGHNRDRLPGEILPEAQSSLLHAVQTARERNRFQQPHPIYTAAFSPDAQTIAAAGADGNLYLWNRQGEHRIFSGKAQVIRSLSFSADGNQVMGLPDTASQGVVQQWDLKHNKVNSLELESPSPVTVATYSADDTTLLTGSADGKVRLWNQQRQWIGQLNPAHPGALTSVASAGGTIASSGADGRILLWNTKGDQVGQLWAGFRIRAMRLEQSGQRIITEDDYNQQAFLWNPQANQWQQYLLGASQQVQSIGLNSNNTIAAQGLNDGTIHLVPFAKQSRFAAVTLVGHTGGVKTVRFSPDGKTLVSGGEDGSLRLWDVFDSTLLTQFHSQEWAEGNVNQVALSPDGQQIVISDSNGKIYLKDIQRNAIVQLGGMDVDKLIGIAFSTDGKTVAVQTKIENSKNSRINLWKLDGQSLSGFSILGQDRIRAFAVNPGATQVASLNAAGKIQLWTTQGQQVGQSSALPTFVPSQAQFLMFSPNGQQMISGISTDQSSGQVCLWSLQTGITLQSCHEISSQTAQFRSDAQQVAIGSSDGKVYLWNLQTQQIVSSAILHPQGVSAIAFSPDGKTIASGGTDGTVRFLDTQAHPIGQPLIEHQTAIRAVAYSANGQTITSLSEDGEIRLWQADWQSWLKTACNRLQNHPVFTNPSNSVARTAKATCQRWVWSITQAPTSTPTPPNIPINTAVEPQAVRLVVRLGERRVYIYRGSSIEATYPVAIGQPGWETPTGNFRIFEMLRDPGWTHPLTNSTVAPGAGNPLGSRWIAFWTDGYNAAGFHGTPDRASVGQAVSHGCLRMRDEDVRALYEWVKLGTPLSIEP